MEMEFQAVDFILSTHNDMQVFHVGLPPPPPTGCPVATTTTTSTTTTPAVATTSSTTTTPIQTTTASTTITTKSPTTEGLEIGTTTTDEISTTAFTTNQFVSSSSSTLDLNCSKSEHGHFHRIHFDKKPSAQALEITEVVSKRWCASACLKNDNCYIFSVKSSTNSKLECSIFNVWVEQFVTDTGSKTYVLYCDMS